MDIINEAKDSELPELKYSPEIKNSCGLSVYIPHNYSKRKTIHQYYLYLKWYEET